MRGADQLGGISELGARPGICDPCRRLAPLDERAGEGVGPGPEFHRFGLSGER